MIGPAQVIRWVRINIILLRHGLDELVFSLPVLRQLRFLLYLFPWNWFRGERPPRGERIRCALEDLGPIFVKFGQMLSTRRDLLPDDIARELSRLQDHVPPFPVEQARGIIERSLGRSLGESFRSFDDVPIASASIAQVHGAVLKDGTRVVVKVVRPAIHKVIRRDLQLMFIFADLAQRYWPEGRRLRPRDVVQEYEKTIIDELDLVREGANASQLRRNFQEGVILYVPAVYWDYTTRDVMVMERISGIPISDIEALEAAGIDLKVLAERGVEIFFRQVFRHNFFHADMHPGNVFVTAEDPTDPRYIAVDFGIMGTLSPSDQRYLAENFHAFFNRDYKRVAELHVESGWVPEDTRVDEFEGAIRTVCEPIFQRPLHEISFGQFLLRLFQTARRFNMEVQPQLVLLQKTVLNIEGLGRDLYPELDLWKTAKPFLERWMSEQVGVRGLLRGARANLPAMLERAPEVPGLAYDVLAQASSGRLTVTWNRNESEALRAEIRRANQRTVMGVTGAALIVGAFLVLALDDGHHTAWLGMPWISWAAGVVGLGLSLLAWLRARRA